MNDENIYVEKNGYLVIGFINSHSELEYTKYKSEDGGTFELDILKEYTKEELEIFLQENVLEI